MKTPERKDALTPTAGASRPSLIKGSAAAGVAAAAGLEGS